MVYFSIFFTIDHSPNLKERGIVRYPQQDGVDIKIATTYAQTNDNIEIELTGGGLAHDILAESVDDERMTNLGADIIRNTAKLSSYAYQQGKNIVKITL